MSCNLEAYSLLLLFILGLVAGAISALALPILDGIFSILSKFWKNLSNFIFNVYGRK